MFTNFCYSENLLAAAVSHFKVLKIGSDKTLDVQGFEWKSNCTEMAKYTYDFKHKIEGEREREREKEIEKEREKVREREQN